LTDGDGNLAFRSRRGNPLIRQWMAEGAEILAKIKRARAALDNAEA
jgi:hypothetical protein